METGGGIGIAKPQWEMALQPSRRVGHHINPVRERVNCYYWTSGFAFRGSEVSWFVGSQHSGRNGRSWDRVFLAEFAGLVLESDS